MNKADEKKHKKLKDDIETVERNMLVADQAFGSMPEKDKVPPVVIKYESIRADFKNKLVLANSRMKAFERKHLVPIMR